MWTSREKNGLRLFWGAVRVEFYWWSKRFGVRLCRDSKGLHLGAHCPPLSLFVSVEAWRAWENERECEFSIYDWRLRLVPYGRPMERRSADSWWVRGVSLDIPDVVFGRMACTRTLVADAVACVVPMPEGNYTAVAKVEHTLRKRPRWFGNVTTEVWLEIPKGIPHAGKGENSWDCGDDGLFGIGGSSIADAIERARQSVLRDRKRYGHASDAAIREALATSGRLH